MNLNIIFATAIICLQKEYILADNEKLRGCRSSKFKCQLQNKMRRLRDFSRTIDPSSRILVSALSNVQMGTEREDNSLQSKRPQLACKTGPDSIFETVQCPQYVDTDPLYCIEIHQLCDRRVNCPYGEDEDQTMCMFHLATQLQINRLEQTLVPLIRAHQNSEMKKADYDAY